MNLDRARSTISWINVKIVQPLSKSLIVYLIYFITAEILISGGRYERDIYLWIVIFFFVIIAEVKLSKTESKKFKTALYSGLWFALTIIAIDYLIVNLLLQGNSFVIFKEWQTISLYAVTLLIPLVQYFFLGYKPKSKQVDPLLTNQKPTL